MEILFFFIPVKEETYILDAKWLPHLTTPQGGEDCWLMKMPRGSLPGLPPGPAQPLEGTGVLHSCSHMLNVVEAYGANYVNKHLGP